MARSSWIVGGIAVTLLGVGIYKAGHRHGVESAPGVIEQRERHMVEQAEHNEMLFNLTGDLASRREQICDRLFSDIEEALHDERILDHEGVSGLR
jgi:hypothetical protein